MSKLFSRPLLTASLDAPNDPSQDASIHTANPTVERRQILRAAFYVSTATVAGGFLSSCGGGGGSSRSSGGTSPAPEVPGEILPGSCEGVVSTGDELNLPLGRLSSIEGQQLDAATQIMIPTGPGTWAVEVVATAGLPVQLPGAGTLQSTLFGGSQPGFTWHTLCDGGATFVKKDAAGQPSGGWVYTSNSEVLGAPAGGCSAISFTGDGEVDDAYTILSNTQQNCAGGISPWDTWISGEEHGTGLMWECDPYQPGQGIAKPALGYFAHEACAIDWRDGKEAVYLTEDAGSGRFYKFVPNADDFVIEGGVKTKMKMESGTLYVLNIDGWENDCYPSDDAAMRELHSCYWVPVENNPEGQSAERARLADAGLAVRGTVFKGGEGIWFYGVPESHQTQPAGGSLSTEAVIFFTTKGDNRVWALDVDNMLIETIFDNSQIDPNFADIDNLVISPWHDVVVVEDPPSSPQQRVMITLPNKEAKLLITANHAGSEITGPAFSPDGKYFYFSSQRRGQGETYKLSIPPEIWDDASYTETRGSDDIPSPEKFVTYS